ncbi:hypothetical protein BWR18_21160 (plasmid) [Tateyamaria omphalii]|uniref:Sulfotransferase domain-containing protein n=2 Tax=Tateyamaria omphalii TaxID=299262 RepID=A0A1P8N223_9RHOB|nr:hypothetical protein BWR18_21160 [Tateyamaria omphalii]
MPGADMAWDMAQDMDRGVFLLGVGGQKCGTSWLHDMLMRSAQVDMGFNKEYHIFDARTLPECVRFKNGPLKRYDRQVAAGTPPAPGSKLWLRAHFLREPDTYYDYFAQRLAAPDIRLTGDITPSYSGLSTDTLAEIRDGMAARGVPTKVVFLMRDPVERSWSALRMSRRQTALKNPGHVFKLSEFDQLRANYKEPNYELRANYAATLARLETVFDAGDIFVEFYETLFAQDVMDRFCAFAGIDPIDADMDKQVNPSPKTSAIPEDIAEEMALHYAAIYRTLADRFGADPLKSMWWSARFVL